MPSLDAGKTFDQVILLKFSFFMIFIGDWILLFVFSKTESSNLYSIPIIQPEQSSPRYAFKFKSDSCN